MVARWDAPDGPVREDETVLKWLRRRRQNARLERIHAELLIREFGDDAYWEAKRRAVGVVLPDGSPHQGHPPIHWRRVRLRIRKMTGQGPRGDTATRMAQDAGLLPTIPVARMATAVRRAASRMFGFS